MIEIIVLYLHTCTVKSVVIQGATRCTVTGIGSDVIEAIYLTGINISSTLIYVYEQCNIILKVDKRPNLFCGNKWAKLLLI